MIFGRIKNHFMPKKTCLKIARLFVMLADKILLISFLKKILAHAWKLMSGIGRFVVMLADSILVIPLLSKHSPFLVHFGKR